MAFVNENLTPEQREEFGKRGINNPCLTRPEPIKPYHVTVDRDKNCFLVEIAGDRDYPYGARFLFIWGDKNYWVQFDGNTSNEKWSWVIPNENNYFIKERFPYNDDPQFISDLREALQAFGVNGRIGSENSAKINF